MPFENTGVVEICPAPGRPAFAFTQIFVSETFEIPEQKPDAEQIILAEHNITLEDVQLVKFTDPAGNEWEKVFVAGNIYKLVQYSAAVPEQTVHFVKFQLPFQTILVDDCGNPFPLGTIPTDYVVHVCVEKQIVTLLDERHILVEVLLMVWLEDAV
ncbi:DUF3794 domain-containing protein [Metallumcola ferriviriculae]|uniref:DUF3794 domain-containing protein n=1 Tax=Metallumcola ferriviriculae TaxID=3039180 RepID=A0AAU0ULA5_9FIRM|nr:DUF3794 domain-containing protein [Desulfitibacteraceae bacterium MK1]